MAITGWSTGTLRFTALNDSTAIPMVIENIRYYSSTGGAGKTCILRERNGSASVFFRGRVSASYGLAPASYIEGKLVRGVVATSLPEGYLEIDLK